MELFAKIEITDRLLTKAAHLLNEPDTHRVRRTLVALTALINDEIRAQRPIVEGPAHGRAPVISSGRALAPRPPSHDNGDHGDGWSVDFGAGPAADPAVADLLDQDALDRAADQLRRDQQIADAKRVKEAFELRVRGQADTAGDAWLYDHPLLVCKQCNTAVRPGWIAVKTPTSFWVCGGCYLETNWSAYRHGPQGAGPGPGPGRAPGDVDADGFNRLYEEFLRTFSTRSGKTTFNFGQYDMPGGARVERCIATVPAAERERVVKALLKSYHPDVNASPDAEAVTRALLAALARTK